MKGWGAVVAAGMVGLGVGWMLPFFGDRDATADEVRRSSRVAERVKRTWLEKGRSATERMAEFAQRAGELDGDEWPGFFRSHLELPQWRDFAAALWAAEDPGGFWKFLREEGDVAMLDRFGRDLLMAWAEVDADGAMTAAIEIKDKARGDVLRRAVVDGVIEKDLEKGLELAVRAGEFNRFSWGARDWISRDPEAAVKGVAGLPKVSKYRDFLKIAIAEWAAKDPQAAMAWMRDEQPRREEARNMNDRWMTEGFRAAAGVDAAAALAVAREIADPVDRDLALGGVVLGGDFSMDEKLALLKDCTPPTARLLGLEMISRMGRETREEIEESTDLVLALPMNQDTVKGVGYLAQTMARLDWDGGWAWADALPDGTLRRKAVEELVNGAGGSRVAELAGRIGETDLRDLSDGIFQAALGKVPEGERAGWIGRLPAGHAEWAREVAGR